jgi:hypothetical protein
MASFWVLVVLRIAIVEVLEVKQAVNGKSLVLREGSEGSH